MLGLAQPHADRTPGFGSQACGIDLVKSEPGDARAEGDFGVFIAGVGDLERRRLVDGGRELKGGKTREGRRARRCLGLKLTDDDCRILGRHDETGVGFDGMADSGVQIARQGNPYHPADRQRQPGNVVEGQFVAGVESDLDGAPIRRKIPYRGEVIGKPLQTVVE